MPSLLVVLTVVGLIAAWGWNRSGPPLLTITLTERELQMPYSSAPAPGDDAGLQLRAAYALRVDPLDARNWLPESRLREIGFVFDVLEGSPEAARAYGRMPPRLAWVALEYDGPAWREIERRRLLVEPEGVRQVRGLRSRLVPVDAAREFEALSVRYPSGHLIARAIVGVAYLPPDRGGPLVYGTLRRLVPDAVAVPAAMRGVFDALQPLPAGPDPRPRYDVEVAIGRLGLPYLRSVRPLP
jgi:hypothetical protein